ncbi:hypothetical protein ABFT23_10225 [Nocardioides sp. C4-1]|uniref:M50 family metallopeptidase n=1 Tax=Nocardioides sp. C4-1 TaxID=3151851 RepID=UPI0032650B35
MPTTSDLPPWSVRLGRVAGTPVQVSASCLLVIAVIAVAFAPRARDLVPELGGAAVLAGVAVGAAVYLAALAHEAAHAVVARRHGRDVAWIRISAGGGRTQVRGRATTPAELARIAAAGPVLSLAVGLLALVARIAIGPGVVALVLEALVLANLLIGLLDLLPAPPLDGGRLVHAWAWRVAGSRHRGAVVSAWVGRVTAGAVLAVVLAWAVASTRPPRLTVWLVAGLLAAMIWLASEAQLTSSRVRERLAGTDVSHLVRPLTGPVVPGARRVTGPVSADDVLLVVQDDEPGTDAVLVVVDADGVPTGTLRLSDVEHSGAFDAVRKRP